MMNNKPTRIGLRFMRARARQTLRWCNLSKGKTLLEIGPGRGILAKEAVSMIGPHSYYAVDRDKNVRKLLPANIYFRQADVPYVFVGDLKTFYDAVVMESVLEHCSNHKEATTLLHYVFSMMKPKARLVLRAPAIQFARWSFWEHTEDHGYVTSLPRVVKLLEATGFDVLQAGYGLDHFRGPIIWPIWIAAQCVKWPVWLIERLCDVPPWTMSLSVKFKYKQPHAYVVAQRRVSL